MSLGSWPEAAASDRRAATTAMRNRVRKNTNRSVLDDGAWPLIFAANILTPQPDGSVKPQLLCTFRSFKKYRVLRKSTRKNRSDAGFCRKSSLCRHNSSSVAFWLRQFEEGRCI